MRKDWERLDCPVCDGATFLDLFEAGGEPFVKCVDCGLVLINPRPVRSQLMATYDTDYSRSYMIKAPKKLRRARRWVSRIQKRFTETGRWLDVGCSAGFVVKAAAEAGFEAHGLDLEPAGLRYAREVLGLENIRHGTLVENDYPAAYFDVISLYDVIEHVPDLRVLLAALSRVLVPGGVIEIRTPDINHFRVPKNLETWGEIKPTEHLYYFSKSTLARLLDRYGLQIVGRLPSLKPGLKVYVQHAQAH